MKHEHRAGNMILAKRLNKSGLPIEAVVLEDIGYPKDESVSRKEAAPPSWSFAPDTGITYSTRSSRNSMP